MNEQSASSAGTPWSEDEIDIIVHDYFDMLTKELKGTAYRKIDHNRRVQSLTGRSKGSVEYKYQNVSAVLNILGCPYIRGYLPAKNIQNALLPGVERFLQNFDLASMVGDSVLVGANKSQSNDSFAEIEVARQIPDPLPAHSGNSVVRLIRKFDPAARDARMQEIGMMGEERVFFSEQNRLRRIGRKDLSRKVRWVSKEDGDGAGYDILSFSSSGQERFLEVKTTMGGERTPFYVSRNEKLFAEENPRHSRIFRLFNMPLKPRAFIVKPPLEDKLILTPQNYQAQLR